MTLTPPPPARRTIQHTNSLIILLPEALFAHQLLPLFEAHFASYGELVSWTALEKLGRVFAVYEEVESAAEARREMDGFVWEDEAEMEEKRELNGGVVVVAGGVQVVDDAHAREFRTPLRVFFGPQLSLPLAALHSTLLSVPALSKNFLISPPGSPPVGWEQTLEEAPNSQTHAEDVLEDAGGGGDWADELARALRFLSVKGGGEDEDGAEEGQAEGQEQMAVVDGEGEEPTTSLVVPAHSSRPAVTVSTPDQPSLSTSEASTPPPPGAQKITAVKATIESLLGRKRSMSDLRQKAGEGEGAGAGARTPGGSLFVGGDALGGGGGGLGAGARITPTARPPVAPEREFVA